MAQIRTQCRVRQATFALVALSALQLVEGSYDSLQLNKAMTEVEQGFVGSSRDLGAIVALYDVGVLR